jgi:hypothetical protein
MWRVGGVDALPPKTVSESVALVLPVFATCHILDLRSFQFASLTRIRLGAFPTQEPGLHLESRQALVRGARLSKVTQRIRAVSTAIVANLEPHPAFDVRNQRGSPQCSSDNKPDALG